MAQTRPIARSNSSASCAESSPASTIFRMRSSSGSSRGRWRLSRRSVCGVGRLTVGAVATDDAPDAAAPPSSTRTEPISVDSTSSSRRDRPRRIAVAHRAQAGVRLDAHVHAARQLEPHRAHRGANAMLAWLQVQNLQAHRASLRLRRRRSRRAAAGDAARVGGQVHQSVHVDQLDLARVGLDAQLAAFEVAHADAAGVGLHRCARTSRGTYSVARHSQPPRTS